MIPAIFRAKSGLEITRHGADPAASMAKSQRYAGALIGIAGAIGAFGGVLVNLAFRQSFLATKSADAAYVAFICFYAICFVVTWYVYLRPSSEAARGCLSIARRSPSSTDSPRCRERSDHDDAQVPTVVDPHRGAAQRPEQRDPRAGGDVADEVQADAQRKAAGDPPDAGNRRTATESAGPPA